MSFGKQRQELARRLRQASARSSRSTAAGVEVEVVSVPGIEGGDERCRVGVGQGRSWGCLGQYGFAHRVPWQSDSPAAATAPAAPQCRASLTPSSEGPEPPAAASQPASATRPNEAAPALPFPPAPPRAPDRVSMRSTMGRRGSASLVPERKRFRGCFRGPYASDRANV